MNGAINNSNEESFKMQNINRRFDFIVSCLISIIDLSFIILGVSLVRKDLLIAVSFLVVYTYKQKLFSLLRFSAQMLELCKKFNVACNRVFDILDGDAFEKEEFGDKHLERAIRNY